MRFLHSRKALVAAATALGLVAVGLQATAAAADTSPVAGAPATVSADQLPTWQLNGVVWAQVTVGNTVYVAGNFTAARPPGVAAGGAGEIPANDVFAYDITTGNPVTSFNHQLNGQANSIAASPDGSRVYIGGDFTTVDGSTRSHIAAFDTATNALSTTFKPIVSSQVSAFAVTNSTVYIGGEFLNAGGQPRSYLAAFAAATGAVLPWAPVAAGGTVSALVVSPDSSRVIAGGRFTTLNGTPAYGMGSLDASTGATLAWAANTKIHDGGVTGAITSLQADGTQIYGSGYSYNGTGNFEGTFGADPSTGKLNWVNDCHGDTYSIIPIGQVLYTVGHAHTCQWIGAFPNAQPTYVNHRALAFTTFPTGTNTGPDDYGWNYAGLPASSLLQWFPDLAPGTVTGQNQAAWSITGNSQYVALGGEFPQVNGVNQAGLVRFAVTAKAPDLKGPRLFTAGPTVTTAGGGSATVSWPTTWDQDNQYLTYRVFRDGGTTPIYTVNQASTFWTLPTLKFTDSGLAAGSTHTYVVQAVDPFNNKLTGPASSAVTILGGTANTSPAATIGAPSCTYLACSFDGSGSLDPDGSIASYAWDFADGGTSTAAKPSHTYALAGTYVVKLTVTDDQGAVTTSTTSVTVAPKAANQPPVAVISTPACTYLTCSFSGAASHDPNGAIASYVWDFGDGTPVAAGVSPSHTYAAGGTYTVKLTAVDGLGLTNTTTGSVTIATAVPVSVIATPTCTYLTCTFNGAGSTDADGTVVSYSWQFGDGTSGTGATPTHSFPHAGNYTVGLKVTDNLGAKSIPVYVVVQPTATLTALALTDSPATIATYGSPVRLTAVVAQQAAGSVAFYDGGTVIGRVATSSTGVAVFTTSGLTVAKHSLRAIFTPTDATVYRAAASNFLGLNVVKATSSVTIKTSTTTAKLGAVVHMSVAVALHGTPLKATGIIQVMDGKTKTLSVRIISGLATFGLPKYKVGGHVLTVVYLGSTTALGSTSAKKPLTIRR